MANTTNPTPTKFSKKVVIPIGTTLPSDGEEGSLFQKSDVHLLYIYNSDLGIFQPIISNLSLGTITSVNVPITNSNGSGITTLPAATALLAGILTAGTQTIGGNKTLQGDVYVTGNMGVGGSVSASIKHFVNIASTTTKGIVIKGSAGQAVSLAEFLDSTGATLSFFGSDGGLRTPLISNPAGGSVNAIIQLNTTGVHVQSNKANADAVQTINNANILSTGLGLRIQFNSVTKMSVDKDGVIYCAALAVNRMLKTDGFGNISNAVAGTDYALGNVNTISAASALALSSNGYYKFTGTNTTWTLGAVASSTGFRVTLINRGTGTITLNSNAGANDIDESGVFSNTTPIATMSNMTLYCDGTKWIILD